MLYMLLKQLFYDIFIYLRRLMYIDVHLKGILKKGKKRRHVYIN